MTQQFTIQLVLDQCLDQIRAGQATVTDCVAKHPTIATELKALLQIALAIERIPKIAPSDEFRRATRERILHSAERGDERADSRPGVAPEPDPPSTAGKTKQRVNK